MNDISNNCQYIAILQVLRFFFQKGHFRYILIKYLCFLRNDTRLSYKFFKTAYV